MVLWLGSDFFLDLRHEHRVLFLRGLGVAVRSVGDHDVERWGGVALELRRGGPLGALYASLFGGLSLPLEARGHIPHLLLVV